MNLGPQLGPFPAGVWAAIGAGGIGLAVLGSRGKAAPVAAPAIAGTTGVPLDSVAVRGNADNDDTGQSQLDAYAAGVQLGLGLGGGTPGSTTTTGPLAPVAVPARSVVYTKPTTSTFIAYKPPDGTVQIDPTDGRPNVLDQFYAEQPDQYAADVAAGRIPSRSSSR